MFFPGSSGPKISLGGRSEHETSRAEVLRKNREEREKRQQRKKQHAAVTCIQVCCQPSRLWPRCAIWAQ